MNMQDFPAINLKVTTSFFFFFFGFLACGIFVFLTKDRILDPCNGSLRS